MCWFCVVKFYFYFVFLASFELFSFYVVVFFFSKMSLLMFMCSFSFSGLVVRVLSLSVLSFMRRLNSLCRKSIKFS